MEKENKTENKIVQTYADDMAKVIENDTEGLVKKIIHGEEEHEKEKRNLSPQSKKNKLFMLIGILLVFSAFAILSFFSLKKNTNTVPVERQFVPIIFSDQSIFLEISGRSKDEIAQTVLNEVSATKVKNGGVEGIYLMENKQIVGLRKFISLIGSSFIPGDNLLFVQDNFLMGAVNNATKDFFILLKVRSTADIFDSLRVWEEKMFSDLHGFFGINIGSEARYFPQEKFQNIIVENKNARALYDQDGKLVLMYIFADDNSVIITDSPEGAREIMLRLAGSQAQQ